MHLDRRLIGWGLFFIVVGAVPLAVRAGLLSADVAARWPLLWPLLIIGWGLGLILRRTPLDWLGGAVAAVTLGLMGGGLLAAGFAGVPAFVSCGTGESGAAFSARSGTFHDGARMNVEFNCGRLTVAGADGTEWRVSGTDASGRGPEVHGTADSVTLRSPNEPAGFFRTDAGQVVWNVSLPRQPSLDLALTLNAGQGNVDLRGTHLGAFNVTVNAGNLDVALDRAASMRSLNVTVNAGKASLSLPVFAGDANASLNAGSLEVCVPEGEAVRVHWSGALAANDFDRNGLVRVDDTTWTTLSFDATRPHIELHVSANAGQFNLQLGGSCGA